jgi:ribosomal protein S18 acetylase RimI-like enzyme
MYGTGVGQALLDTVLGEEPAIVWIAEQNERAQAFYRKNKFELDGATKFDGISEVRMLR